MSAEVLLVDDEPGVRESVQAYLSESDLTVTVASNATEAWSKIQENPPDLVISDIMMPDVDGYQFLQKLREDERFQSLPVVFLSAKGLTGDRISGYETGCDVYLSKPFDPEELEAIVKSLLSRRISQSSNTELNLIADQVTKILNILQPEKDKQQTVLPIEPIDLKLTPREQDILNLVVEGLMNKEIASRLDVGIRNVEKYVSTLREKTGTKTRTELVRFALEHGLINR
ncbi:MAG: response regulator transcription factor [Moorea sp. SIO2B7]|nr:response regulator transcription factor [Moorena sp. SIO2B7]